MLERIKRWLRYFFEGEKIFRCRREGATLFTRPARDDVLMASGQKSV